MYSDIILWPLTLIIFIMLIIILKEIQLLYKGKVIDHLVNTTNNKETTFYNLSSLVDNSHKLLFLFLSVANDEMKSIQYLQTNYPEFKLYIIYVGPIWKANLLNKKITGSYTLLVDEKAEFCKKFVVFRFPTYMIINSNNGRILKTKTLYKEVKG
jgi:hypothetical protein